MNNYDFKTALNDIAALFNIELTTAFKVLNNALEAKKDALKVLGESLPFEHPYIEALAWTYLMKAMKETSSIDLTSQSYEETKLGDLPFEVQLSLCAFLENEAIDEATYQVLLSTFPNLKDLDYLLFNKVYNLEDLNLCETIINHMDLNSDNDLFDIAIMRFYAKTKKMEELDAIASRHIDRYITSPTLENWRYLGKMVDIYASAKLLNLLMDYPSDIEFKVDARYIIRAFRYYSEFNYESIKDKILGRMENFKVLLMMMDRQNIVVASTSIEADITQFIVHCSDFRMDAKILKPFISMLDSIGSLNLANQETQLFQVIRSGYNTHDSYRLYHESRLTPFILKTIYDIEVNEGFYQQIPLENLERFVKEVHNHPSDAKLLEREYPHIYPYLEAVESYVKEKNPNFVAPVKKIKVGRNDPCPCGSGKKYKQCCGK